MPSTKDASMRQRIWASTGFGEKLSVISVSDNLLARKISS